MVDVAPAPEGNGRLIANRYALVKLLGHGGMGYIWQGHDLVLDRDVAVKEVFVPDPDGEPSQRALREARAAARLSHPGIVTIHDLVIADGRSWIVMELVRARSLDDSIREGMAPERMRGEPATRASDMWSLGITLYAALTGHPPDGPVTAAEAGALAPLIGGLLSPDPRARLTADQASEMLGRVMTAPGPGAAALDQPGQPTRSLRSWQRPLSPEAAAAAVALAAVAVAVTLTIALRGGSPDRTRTASPAGTSSPAQATKTHPGPETPPDYRLYTDSARHFAAAVPDSWLASTEGGARMFCAPGGCPEAVVVVPVSGSNPVADIAQYPLANGHLPATGFSGYRRLWIRPVSYYARAAEAEFTVRTRSVPAGVRGMVRLFTVTNGGQEYYVQVTAPSATWQKALSVFAVFFATFRPAGSHE